MNEHGFIEGCTRKIGNELGLFDIIKNVQSDYNFLCLIPSLLKYETSDICIKTLMFRVKNYNSIKLNLNSFNKTSNYYKELYDHFATLLPEEIVDCYYIDIEYNNLYFFN